MRKKAGVATLAMALCLATGCGGLPQMQATEAATEEQKMVAENTQPATEAEAGAVTEEAQEAVEPEETEPVEETGEEPQKSTDSGSSDVTAVETAVEKPAQIGEWVQTKKRSSVDKAEHTIYFRVTDVAAGADAQKIVDEYNSAGNAVMLRGLEDDSLEYRIVTYECYFPADFPAADYGIADAKVNLQLCDVSGSGAIAGYIGLSSVWDISERPEGLQAGGIFTGRAAFAMVKGSSEYLFKLGYKDDSGTQVYQYVKGQ
ncbi:MAG: hypothetical protein NC300_10390 [Bacteroidales bacterium]|nr:hypothetical protein [Clostridium sp.]MCM1204539.1 hypothetical protein [Bacteroidales bacterium]